MSEFTWVLIPVVAILASNVRRLVLFSAKQRAMTVSTHELETEVAELTRAKAELTERIQNLETIVVSQTWGALQDRGLAPAERELRVATAAHREMGPPESAPLNQQRAEQMARRLQ